MSTAIKPSFLLRNALFWTLGTPWSLLPQTEPKSHVSKYYSFTTIFLIIATKVFVNLPITFNIKLPYLARGNGGVVYVPTVRLTLLYIECLHFHVSPTREPVIFLDPCGNDTLATYVLPIEGKYLGNWSFEGWGQWCPLRVVGIYFLSFTLLYIF